MTAATLVDKTPPNPVRRARFLMAQAESAANPLGLAVELRMLGRPDLAWRLLERCAETPEVSAERLLTLEALGHRRRDPGKSRAGWRVTAARLIAAAAFFVTRALTGRKTILFASMGKFTRLADVVDRIDPKLREIAASGDGGRTRLIVFFFGGYPNRQLVKMYRQHCVIIPCTNRLTRKLGMIFVELLRDAGRFTEITTDYRRTNQSFLKNPPVIGFGDAEKRALERQMETAGIDPALPFIVFGLRDMAYYRFYGDVMNIPLTSQGRRAETHHRCPPLSNYLAFARHWANEGVQVIRMGLRVSERLPPDMPPRVIDYACGPRSDELDVYLFAACKFMVAGDTGLFSGAAAFDRPSVLSDLFLVSNTMYSSNKITRNIFVPKLIFDTRENRYLTFREFIYFNHQFSFAEDCEAEGFKIVHNDPEDILAATIELTERLEGRFTETAEDRERQAAFHAIYSPAHIGYGSTGLVSAAFLKKHAALLD